MPYGKGQFHAVAPPAGLDDRVRALAASDHYKKRTARAVSASKRLTIKDTARAVSAGDSSQGSARAESSSKRRTASAPPPFKGSVRAESLSGKTAKRSSGSARAESSGSARAEPSAGRVGRRRRRHPSPSEAPASRNSAHVSGDECLEEDLAKDGIFPSKVRKGVRMNGQVGFAPEFKAQASMPCQAPTWQ